MELAEQIGRTLHQLLPASSQPRPARQRRHRREALGVTGVVIRQYALDGLARRLDVIGVPLNTL